MRDSFKMIKQRNIAVPELADRMKKALLFLARNGEANIYLISEKCKISEEDNMRYSTAHRSVKALEHEGLVCLKYETKNEKGAPAKVYGLTTKGLHRAIYDLPSWHEKIAIAEKWQSLLNPNVIEWMKFIEVLDDPKTEEMVNTEIGSFLCCSDDLGVFVDVIDDPFFDALVATMIDFDETGTKVMQIIGNFPRLKERLLKLLEKDIAWREEDIKRYKRIEAGFEKL